MLILVIGGTYAFINLTLTGEKKQVIQAGTLSLELDEDENNLTIENALPMYDEVGMIQDAFTFRLINNGTTSANYKLKLVDITPEKIETDQKCSDLGEITIASPEECRSVSYPDELRQESLAQCQTYFNEGVVTNEQECLVELVNVFGSYYEYDSFEQYIDAEISWGTIEDKRVVTETYPDNYVLTYFPKLNEMSVRYGLTKDGVNTYGYVSKYDLATHEEALEMCQDWYPDVTDEASCLTANEADGYYYDSFDDFIDEEVGGVIKKDLIIDFGTIGGGQTIEYEYRMWIDSTVTENSTIEGKSLSFKMDVEISQEGIVTDEECFTYTTNNYVVKDYNACANYLVEKGIDSEYGNGVAECQAITEGKSTLATTNPTEFQEMITKGIIKEENGATITGYTCTDDIIYIPETLSVDVAGMNQLATQKVDVPVVAIGDEAFGSRMTEPTNTTNSDNLLQFMAMTSGSNILKVVIPDNILYIGRGAFGNIGLKEVELSSNLQIINSDAFNFNQLKSIIIPSSVKCIGGYAFVGNQLRDLTIPNGVTSIGDWAFADNQLTNIIIPDSVTEIGSRAFCNNKLTSVVLPNKITTISSEVFAHNQLKEVVIPSSVTNIEMYAFQDNELTNLIIPSDVTSIESAAFSNNPNLVKVINKTGKSFNWNNICFFNYGDSFETGTITNGTQTITITSE